MSSLVAAEALLFVFALTSARPLFGQDLPLNQEEEVKYAEGLNKLGLPNYAEMVLAKLGSGADTKAARLQSYLVRGEFDKVQGIIAAEPDQNSPDAWGMKITLANGYYTMGKYPEARKIYEAFFAQYAGGPPANLRTFYFNSAMNFAQMLILMNDQQAALNTYRTAIKTATPQERDIQRQFQGELGDVLIRLAESTTGPDQQKVLTEVDQLATDLYWLQDVWFGKAVVLQAHAMMLRGNIDGAMALVDDNKDQLVSIDQALQEQSTADEDLTRLSPMAETRYLLGVILLDEAKRALEKGDKKTAEELLVGKVEQRAVGGKPARKLPGALQHFLNVYGRYPNTKWAMDAGAHLEEARTIMDKQLGKPVKAEVPREMMLKVEAEQFRAAKSAFNQQQWETAADQYETLLNRFSDSDNAVVMVCDLASCYLSQKQDIYADMAISFLAERYGKNRKLSDSAGNALLSFAPLFDKDPKRKDGIYEQFFANFTTHPLAAGMLYDFGNKRLAAGDADSARAYFERIVREHADAPLSYDAMLRIAACYEQTKAITNELQTLEAFVARSDQNKRLSAGVIRALFSMGRACYTMDPPQFPLAVRRFNDIEQRLTNQASAYQKTREEEAANQDILESAIFYKALCFARAAPPAGKPENSYKEIALRNFLNLATRYPQSKLASRALSQAGTLWTVFGKPDEAQKVFTALKEKYPDSPEAKNADFALAKSLLALGKRKEALDAFKRMFSGTGQYTDAQVLSAGNELLASKEYEIAVQAYDRVLANAAADNRQLQEPTLAGKGRALVALGQFAEGATTLEKLFAAYPRTGFTVECTYALSKAYSELGAVEADGAKRGEMFNKAVTAMKEALKYDQSTERKGEITVQVGRLFELKAKAETQHGDPKKVQDYLDQALATYQSMVLFEDLNDAKMRPHLEEAFYRGMALFLQAERWQDLFNDATTYLATFPSGKYVLDVRQWRSRAQSRLAMQGAAPAAAAPTAPSAPGGAVAPAPVNPAPSAPAAAAPAPEAAPAPAPTP